MIPMLKWRITKYDPVYRSAQGVYLKDEWTSYSDIERSFQGNKISFDDYINVENAYRTSILLLMDCMRISYFTIRSVEKFSVDKDDPHMTKTMIELLARIHENGRIDRKTIDDMMRLLLREMIWGKLESKDMYVHFGYDYYMYVGVNQHCIKIVPEIQSLGLFVEEYDSPYEMNL